MVGAALVDLAGSRQFWHLPLAFSSDAGIGFTLSGSVVHARDQCAGPDNFAADDVGAGGIELLPH